MKIRSQYNWNIVESGAKHHNDNPVYPRFENYNNFWLVKTPGIKNPYSRVLQGHITGCN